MLIELNFGALDEIFALDFVRPDELRISNFNNLPMPVCSE